MPMIDVYAAVGTFSDRHQLAQELASPVMRWEAVPEIPVFANNTAAFIHDLPGDAISTVAGRSDYVRVQVLTPAGVLDRDKQVFDFELSANDMAELDALDQSGKTREALERKWW